MPFQNQNVNIRPGKSLWIVIVSAYKYSRMKQAHFGAHNPSLGLALIHILRLV